MTSSSHDTAGAGTSRRPGTRAAGAGAIVEGADRVTAGAAVELYWIPLGAGGHVVRLNGKVFERLSALRERRAPCDLYHAALIVRVPRGFFTIESTPVPDGNGRARGVVGGGPVGSRLAGRLRIFRYEIRCWPDGVIPDLVYAAEARRLTEDEAAARRVLDLAPKTPTPVWGRDELRTGEMWNSNSIVSWLLARAGFDMAHVALPDGGRAPGWDAGLVVAARDGGASDGRARSPSDARQ